MTDHFKASIQKKNQPAKKPHRIQNRLTEKFPEEMGAFYQGEFKNEPNTDWSLAANRDWAEKIRQKWQKGPKNKPLSIPLVVAGKEIFDDRDIREAHDPSQIDPTVIVARAAMADAADIDNAVTTARADPDG